MRGQAMKRKRNVIIVLRLSGTAGRDILSGILLFTRQRPHWHTRLFQMPNELTPENFRALAEEGYDGVIMSEPGPDATAELLKASSLPIAFIGDAGPILSTRPTGIAYIRNDDGEIGRMGARYLLSSGRRCSYGFVPTLSRQYWSLARHEGFRDELAGNGLSLQTFASPGPSAGSSQDLAALRRWLEALPKPAAVMAAWDTRATQVLEMANEAKIAVPSQLAVIGVDNDELLDESTVPPLTSIRPDHEKLGFVAARELERLMNGRPATSAVAFLAHPKELIERESATATSPAAHLLARANRFIAQNATFGISARDVATHLGVSRRLADLRFQQFSGETINETIIRCRLDAGKKLLATTNRPIKLVSTACGYADLAYLKTLFKRRFGLTMRAYRAQHSSRAT